MIRISLAGRKATIFTILGTRIFHSSPLGANILYSLYTGTFLKTSWPEVVFLWYFARHCHLIFTRKKLCNTVVVAAAALSSLLLFLLTCPHCFCRAHAPFLHIGFLWWCGTGSAPPVPRHFAPDWDPWAKYNFFKTNFLALVKRRGLLCNLAKHFKFFRTYRYRPLVSLLILFWDKYGTY